MNQVIKHNFKAGMHVYEWTWKPGAVYALRGTDPAVVLLAVINTMKVILKFGDKVLDGKGEVVPAKILEIERGLYKRAGSDKGAATNLKVEVEIVEDVELI